MRCGEEADEHQPSEEQVTNSGHGWCTRLDSRIH
jgi:hypothetical protein